MVRFLRNTCSVLAITKPKSQSNWTPMELNWFTQKDVKFEWLYEEVQSTEIIEKNCSQVINDNGF